jgi:hypothetical protein
MAIPDNEEPMLRHVALFATQVPRCTRPTEGVRPCVVCFQSPDMTVCPVDGHTLTPAERGDAQSCPTNDV